MKQDLDYDFPIKTKTACTSKWGWSTVWLDTGLTASCHRCKRFPLEDDFSTFHNVSGKIKNRQDMLKGEWPGDGCEYCRDIENAGGFSDRMHNNDIPGMAPQELRNNSEEVHVSPTTLEVFVGNVCNFKCTYCSPQYSSLIQKEYEKHGYNPFLNNNENYDNDLMTFSTSQKQKRIDGMFDWLEENIHTLVRFHLLGGETFVQHDVMERLLDLLEKKPSPGLQFCIFSNFNPPDRYFKKYIERIKYIWQQGNIERLELTASIDCWGPQAEYVRSGLDCDKFEENFAFAAEQNEEFVRLNVNQTVTSLTMKTMPELIQMFNKYNEHRHIGHYGMFVDGMYFQRPDRFKYETWDRDWERIFRSMKSDTIEHQQAINIFAGLRAVTRQSKEHNTEDIKRFYNYFDEMDKRRNTNWRDLWPELVIREIDEQR